MAPTESSIYPGVCPEDTKEEYHQSYSWLPFKGHCYLFITDEIEWADAAGSCARHGKKLFSEKKKKEKEYTIFFSQGGILASIEDPEEQRFIQSNVEVFHGSHGSFWIGLYKTHKGDEHNVYPLMTKIS